MITLKFASPIANYSVIVDDNDRVAYAYLLHNDDVVADVWLYNRLQPTSIPEWRSQEMRGAPLLNALDFAEQNQRGPIRQAEDVSVNWLGNNRVLIKIHGLDWALLEPGCKPGWSILAKKNGPLAMPLRQCP